MADKLLEIVQYILGFGPTVMLPVVIFLMAICLGVKLGRAIRSSLTIGMVVQQLI